MLEIAGGNWIKRIDSRLYKKRNTSGLWLRSDAIAEQSRESGVVKEGYGKRHLVRNK